LLSSVHGKLFKFMVFFSHDWGKDTLGRDNHARVVRVCRALAKLGVEGWIDEKYMQGDIDAAMCKGIDESCLMVIFVTERYMGKVTGDHDHDNCQKEFNYGKLKIGSKRTLCIVMDRSCLDTTTWPGQLGMYFGSRLYFDLTDDQDFDAKMEHLAARLRAMASDAGCMVGGGPAGSLVQTVQSRAPEVCGEQWAELISLNPSCLASRSIVRRFSETRKLERFTIGRSKASQLYLSDRLISQIHCWRNSQKYYYSPE